MRNRLLFGPVLIAVLVLLFWLDEIAANATIPDLLRPLFLGKETFPNATVLFPLAAMLSLLAARELAAMIFAKNIVASRRVLSAAALLGLGVAAFVPEEFRGVPSVAIAHTAGLLVLVGSLAFYARRRTVQGVLAGAGGALLSYVYLGLMMGFLIVLRREHSAWTLLWILATVKSCDIGAYFTGKSIGRHKLIPWLSPGKTWEGLAGGVTFSALVGLVGYLLLRRAGIYDDMLVAEAALAGLAFGLVGQIGDLIASLYKRDAGIKDASRSLPGFGGIMDVIDSPMLVAPLAYWWLSLTA